jgi:hypothetical protein
MDDKAKIELMLQEQSQLLAQKGYTEKDLQSPTPDGQLMNELRETLVKLYYPPAGETGIKAMRLGITGLFRSKRDVVDFKLNFLYDSAQKALQLTSVEAHHRGLWKMQVFFNPKSCPTPKEMYDLVRPKARKPKPRIISEDLTQKKGQSI